MQMVRSHWYTHAVSGRQPYKRLIISKATVMPAVYTGIQTDQIHTALAARQWLRTDKWRAEFCSEWRLRVCHATDIWLARRRICVWGGGGGGVGFWKINVMLNGTRTISPRKELHNSVVDPLSSNTRLLSEIWGAKGLEHENCCILNVIVYSGRITLQTFYKLLPHQRKCLFYIKECIKPLRRSRTFPPILPAEGQILVSSSWVYEWTLSCSQKQQLETK